MSIYREDTQFQPRSGTTGEHATFVGEQGEFTVDITKHTGVIHDGVTPGGHPLATEQALNAHKAEDVADGVHGMGSIASQDYEEGTFTPELLFGGSFNGTYGFRFGRYRKFGSLVSIELQIQLSDKGTTTGVATLVGLPFVSNPSNPTRRLIVADFQNLNLPPGTIIVGWNIGTNSAGSTFRASIDGGPNTPDFDDTNFNNNTRFYINGIYHI